MNKVSGMDSKKQVLRNACAIFVKRVGHESAPRQTDGQSSLKYDVS